MLTKRTNILFEEDQWRTLVALAIKEGTSVGDLVRSAINEKYFSASKKQKRQDAYQEILKIRKVAKGRINYKELIDYGKK